MMMMMMTKTILIGSSEISELHFGDNETSSVMECDVMYFGRWVPDFKRKLLHVSR
jgi:hypothetical protein